MADTVVPERFIRVGEAAEVMQVNLRTLRDWADRGLIPHHRTPAGQRRFLRSELEEVLRRRRVEGAA